MIEYQNETRITARTQWGKLLAIPDSSLSEFEPPGTPICNSSGSNPSCGNHLSTIQEDLITLNQQARIDHRELEDVEQVIKQQANLLRLRQALKLRVRPKSKNGSGEPITFLTP